MSRITWFGAAIALVVSVGAVASDVEKEKRWADQIVDALIEGEAVWLSDGEREFLGIYTEAEDPASKAGAIIAHGIGVHPDWQQVVYPLRTGLPPLGWHTLSLQMPILPNDAEEAAYAALMGEVAPRLDAGVSFLRERGVERIVIIGHSLGSTMASYYLSAGGREVDGFVAIGMPAGIEDSDIVNAEMVADIEVPMLDLYGSEDLSEVLAAAPAREKAKEGGDGGAYESRKVDGANHFFDGKEEVLLDSVADWLGTALAED
jgi:alpha/beta superfamily hydrolase